jgi:PKD repeat protein
MQLAPNGKIYVARTNVDSIPVINYPDIKGTGCNYIHSAQPLPPNGTNSFPMFSNDQIRPNFSFTTTASCSKANFTIPQSCLNSANTYTWNFGDTFSGTANTSTIINPSHIFSSAGAYTVTLTINTGCAPYSVSRTLTVQSSPSFTITGKQKICKGESTIITLSGADSYSWSSGQSTHTVALNPTVTTVYTVITTFTANSCSGLKTVTVTVSDCLGLTSQYGEESFIIFPNPGSGHYLITATENGRLTISNNTGSNCIVREINKGQNNLDISQLPIGIYIFSLSTSNGVLVKKLIKESE